MTKQIAKRAAAKAATKAQVKSEPLAAKLAKAKIAALKQNIPAALDAALVKSAAKAKGKLPVPPPTAAQKAASAAPKALDDLPAFLDRKANGIQPAKVAPPKAAVAVLKAAQAGGGLTGMVATALLDSAKAKAAPVAKGAVKAPPAAKAPSAAMPLTGKAALRAIAAASSAPVTKVAPGVKGEAKPKGSPASLAFLRAEQAKPGLTAERKQAVAKALAVLGDKPKAEVKKAAAKPAGNAVRHARFDWAGAAEIAATGKLPPAPDLSALTHRRFEPVLKDLVAFAKKGDKKAFAKRSIPIGGSSMKAVLRWRSLAAKVLKVSEGDLTKPASTRKH